MSRQLPTAQRDVGRTAVEIHSSLLACSARVCLRHAACVSVCVSASKPERCGSCCQFCCGCWLTGLRACVVRAHRLTASSASWGQNPGGSSPAVSRQHQHDGEAGGGGGATGWALGDGPSSYNRRRRMVSVDTRDRMMPLLPLPAAAVSRRQMGALLGTVCLSSAQPCIITR